MQRRETYRQIAVVDKLEHRVFAYIKRQAQTGSVIDEQVVRDLFKVARSEIRILSVHPQAEQLTGGTLDPL